MLRIDFGARLQQFSLIALILGLKKMNTLNSHLLSTLLMKSRLSNIWWAQTICKIKQKAKREKKERGRS